MIYISISGGTGKEVPSADTVCDAAMQAGLNPEAYLFLVDGTPVPSDMPVADGMTVTAVRIASGG